ncbi:MAG TPA: SBBP repeat-containing protein [bacterium]|nr:SBBP repeat-containing protein [bacterium]
MRIQKNLFVLKYLLFILPALSTIPLLVYAQQSKSNQPQSLRPHSISPQASLRLDSTYGHLPLYFEPNMGQADPKVKYLSRGRGYTLYLTEEGPILSLASPSNREPQASPMVPKPRMRIPSTPTAPKIVSFKLDGGNPHPAFEGIERTGAISNYFIGKDPSKWRTKIPLYTQVKLKDVYPGVDMVYYGKQGHLEYDFIVKPGADPKAIKLTPNGPNKMDFQGNLILESGKQKVIMKAPEIYQIKDGQKVWVAGRFNRFKNLKIDFRVDRIDPLQTLVIDPQLDFSTYIGGSGNEEGRGIVVSPGGNVFLAGDTGSVNFPISPNAPQTTLSGSGDAFVFELNSTGSDLIYSTYLGGTNSDFGIGIVIDINGNTYLAGTTYSSDFPITPGAPQSLFGGGSTPQDGFIAKLDSTGSALVFSTYVGGSSDDLCWGITLDSSNNIYVTGSTSSLDFPTTAGAYQTTYGGRGYSPTAFDGDAFVTKINSSGTSFLYSTYLGGNGTDVSSGIAVDLNGSAYITGAAGPNFPTTAGVIKPIFGAPGNGQHVFISELNPSGSGLVFSTYLGGSSYDSGTNIVLDASNNCYVVGSTDSADFPTTAGAYQATYAGNMDCFLTKINSTGTSLVYSTLLGGPNDDWGNAIAIDLNGNTYVTGTVGQGFPTTKGAFQQTYAGGYNTFGDAFVAKIDQTGTFLLYSSYLGGGSDDSGDGIALDPIGNVYIYGFSSSSDFPTTGGAFQTSLGGPEDAFVVKFDATAFDTPTPTPPISDAFFVSKNLFRPANNESVSIHVECSSYPGNYNLLIYNSAGEFIRQLDKQVLTGPLWQDYLWDGTNTRNEKCASGLYLIFMNKPSSHAIKRVLLVR